MTSTTYFREAGINIYNRTRLLTHKLNTELLTPISVWIDDPSFTIKIENSINWAKIKRQQRQWTKTQRALASERLRQYWVKINNLKILRKKVSALLKKPKQNDASPLYLSTKSMSVLSNFLNPFTSHIYERRKIAQEFRDVQFTIVSRKLPWRSLLSHSLQGKSPANPTTFKSLPIFWKQNLKSDKISKFQTLLQMDSEGLISLLQVEHFGEIKISLMGHINSRFMVKDNQGRQHFFDLLNLNKKQREKIINDVSEQKIICREIW